MPLANQQNPPQQLSARGVRNDDEDDEERLDEPGGAGPLFDADTTGGELREVINIFPYLPLVIMLSLVLAF